MSMNINNEVWQQLHEVAVAASRRAYVPYSNYPVGAAAITTDGRIFSGCNVENAAYGVGLCAECGLISDLVKDGGGRLAAFTCVNGLGERIVPCGRCRQLLFEHGGQDLLVDMPTGVLTMREVLPQGFGPDDLDEVRSQPPGEITPITGARQVVETCDEDVAGQVEAKGEDHE